MPWCSKATGCACPTDCTELRLHSESVYRCHTGYDNIQQLELLFNAVCVSLAHHVSLNLIVDAWGVLISRSLVNRIEVDRLVLARSSYLNGRMVGIRGGSHANVFNDTELFHVSNTITHEVTTR